jgi:hypothetical protein
MHGDVGERRPGTGKDTGAGKGAEHRHATKNTPGGGQGRQSCGHG